MRRYESPAENWPRAFWIAQTYSRLFSLLFKYINAIKEFENIQRKKYTYSLPVFSNKIVRKYSRLISLFFPSWLTIAKIVSYRRRFIFERWTDFLKITINWKNSAHIEKKKRRRRKLAIPKHFSKCSPSRRRRFRPATSYFCQAGRVRIARTALDKSSPVHYGGSGGNSTSMRHREYPAARNLFHSRARIGRPSIRARGGEERISWSRGFQESRLPPDDITQVLRHALRSLLDRSSSWNGPAITFQRALSRSLSLAFSQIYRARAYRRSLTRALETKTTIWKIKKKEKVEDGEKMKKRTTRRLSRREISSFHVPFMITSARYTWVYIDVER